MFAEKEILILQSATVIVLFSFWTWSVKERKGCTQTMNTLTGKMQISTSVVYASVLNSVAGFTYANFS